MLAAWWLHSARQGAWPIAAIAAAAAVAAWVLVLAGQRFGLPPGAS